MAIKIANICCGILLSANSELHHTHFCVCFSHSFSSSGLITWIPQTFTVTYEHVRFLLFSFSVLHLLVVVSVRQIKLTHVGFRAHIKIASRIVSYRIL